jgi:CheY-like chemotaxis protein
MSDNPSSYPTDEFAAWVRDALTHLYDAPYLQSHLLTKLLSNGDQDDPLQRTQRLRRLLLDAIHAVRPAPGTPASSPDWRHYRLLELRYVEAMTPRQAMEELSLSRSQFFREQAAVLDTLIAVLWNQLGSAVSAPPKRESPDDEADHESLQTALRRITAHATWDEIDLTDVVANLIRVVDPLARERNVHLRLSKAEDLPTITGDRVLVRQALLDVLTWALERAAGGTVTLGGASHANAGLEVEAGICIVAEGDADEPRSGDDAALAVCRQVLGSMGGTVETAIDDRAWHADILWPRREPLLVAVDDNEDFIALYQRYLGPHGWRVLGASSVEEARRLLRETSPSAVVLDVLMPDEDGWELLLWMQEQPRLAELPVVICSVLDQSHLATSLGAAGYLKKPVTQEALVGLLSRWYRSRPSQATTTQSWRQGDR